MSTQNPQAPVEGVARVGHNLGTEQQHVYREVIAKASYMHLCRVLCVYISITNSMDMNLRQTQVIVEKEEPDIQ